MLFAFMKVLVTIPGSCSRRRSRLVLASSFLSVVASPFVPTLAAFYVQTAEGVATGCGWVQLGAGGSRYGRWVLGRVRLVCFWLSRNA